MARRPSWNWRRRKEQNLYYYIYESSMIGNIKGIIDKVASRKLGVTAVAGAAAATGAVEITWPIAAIAMAYILGQAAVDAWGEG